MDRNEPISISSTDSESDSRDLDEYGVAGESIFLDTGTSSNKRVLPRWDSTSGASLSGHGGTEFSSPKRALSFNGSTSNLGHNSRTLLQIRDGSSHSLRNEYESHLYHNPVKRVLPASLHEPLQSSTSSVSINNIGNGRTSENPGKTLDSARPNTSHSKDFVKDHFGRGSIDDIMIYNNHHGSRVLPPSIAHSTSVPMARYGIPSESLHRSGITEETVGDERLIYQAALQDLHQPKTEADLPDGLLTVSLLRHQKIALSWMLNKEGSVHCLGGILADDQGLGKTISVIALILMWKSLEKQKSEESSAQKTEALNLDDDDEDESKGTAGTNEAKAPGDSDMQVASTSGREFRTSKPPAGTLVVCPASVLRQWARELEEKVGEEAKLSVLVYHGGNRTKDPDELATYDVVVTTYAIVKNEVPPYIEDDDGDQKNGERHGLSSEFSISRKRKVYNPGKKNKRGRKGISSSVADYGCGTLARVSWYRVVLDEAQTIKNHRTQVARSCCGLRAKKRWCLSGTPIQNSIDELFSYFRFLRYDPYAKFKSFCSTIKFPISRNSVQGYMKLQAVLRAIMLRRTKGTLLDGKPIVTLPPKSVNMTTIDFSTEERAFYSKLEADSRSQFKAYAAAGTVNQNYANILLMLLRLRQACDHPLLVKGFDSCSFGKFSTKVARRLPKDMLIELLKLLETSIAICSICRDPPEDAVITLCEHVFCYQCVSEYLTGDENTCPYPKCKEQLGSDVVFSEATLRSCLYDDVDNCPSSSNFSEKSALLNSEYSSSKIKAALDIILSHCGPKIHSSEQHNLSRCNGKSSSLKSEFPDSDVDDPTPSTMSSSSPAEGPIKAIVFSQWTRMLDLLEMALNQHCVMYRRLDGTMSLAARDRAVKEFNTNPEVIVMVMSLKAGNLGLNMVAASHVILLDLWWNPTTEDQAVDRAHRIGQTRPVTVSRLTIKDTVEDRILSLQEEKRKMVASAFGEDQSGGSASRLTVEDLKFLFYGVH